MTSARKAKGIVFREACGLKRGDTVSIKDADGKTAKWIVTKVLSRK